MEEISGKIMGLKNIQASAADDLRTLSMSEEVWIQKLVSIDSNYTSPKTKKLKSLVKAIVDYNDDFKVIIFSRFARMVNILEDELSQMPEVKKTAKIYGAFNENRRDEEIQKFLNDDECRIIIMSDAGAEGYNLQNASHLINFDEPWNPATLDQRNGRIRRIGSKWKDIFITNLITRNSVDIQIHETITKKRKYFDKIVENTDSQTKALKEFLKKVI
jgi:SNF2 family DNA or RNA helicase